MTTIDAKVMMALPNGRVELARLGCNRSVRECWDLMFSPISVGIGFSCDDSGLTELVYQVKASESILWRFPKMGALPKWTVYNGESYQNGSFWGTTIYGHLHIEMSLIL